MFRTFVGRSAELKMFDRRLQAAMRGENHLLFIAGDAGIGKTMLIQESCRRAEQEYDDLVVMFGACSMLTEDIGTEPYRPFKDIFRTLTSGPDEQVTGPTVTDESLRRIRRIFGQVIDALAELGPDLVGLFVPVAGLLAKIGTYAAGRKGRNKRLATQPEARGAELSQDLIFEQFSRVVLHLASQFPLILVLDDLQWADRASLNLLFYLARGVSTEKLLVVGAYRPADIQQGRAGAAHPLVRILNELQRYFGEITIDLNEASEIEGRVFVDALLDSEPNALDEEFQAWLFQRTGGQPLFTVEILQDLHERGLLVQDEQSRWVILGEADLESLPTRVEAVIAERIRRLSEELRSILTCGSVMGETFTAEVISRVEEIEQRSLLRKLSQVLEQQHRLVQEAGAQMVNDNRLHFFKFVHILFHQYIYHQLGPAEQEILHLTVGQTLEILYGDEVESIAPQLAPHFHLGHDLEKAAHYYEIAGERAAQQYANGDAVAFYTQALDLLREDGLLRRFNLLAARERANEPLRERQAQSRDLKKMSGLAQRLSGTTIDSKRAYVHNRKCVLSIRKREYDRAGREAEAARSLASEDGDKRNEAYALFNLGRVRYHQQRYHESIKFLLEGLQKFKEVNARSGEADCFFWLGVSSWYTSEKDSVRYIEEALEIQRELGKNWDTSYSLRSLGNYYLASDLQNAEHFLNECLNIRESIGDRAGKDDTLGDRNHGIAAVKADLALLYCCLGQYDRAEDYCRSSMDIVVTAWSPGILAMIYAEQGRYKEALALLEEERAYLAKNPSYLARYKHKMGRIQLLINNPVAAKENVESALAFRSEIGQIGNQTASLALLAQTLRASNEPEKALETALQAIERLEAGTGTGLYRPQEVWFDCYMAMIGIGDEAKTFYTLQRAQEMVVDQATRLSDPKRRQSFLTNVQLNRGIEAEWRKRNRTTGL